MSTESVITQHSAAEIIRQLLIDLDTGTGESLTGYPVTVDMEPDQPDNCTTVYNTDGVLHGRLQINGEVQEHPGIQIRVRGARTTNGTGDATHGKTIAYDRIALIVLMLDQFVRMTTVTVETTQYRVHALSRTSSIINVGRMRDNSERYVYTVNYTASIAQIIP